MYVDVGNILIIDEDENEKENHIGFKKLLKNKIRKLDDGEINNYEIINEDKYGKINLLIKIQKILKL